MNKIFSCAMFLLCTLSMAALAAPKKSTAPVPSWRLTTKKDALTDEVTKTACTTSGKFKLCILRVENQGIWMALLAPDGWKYSFSMHDSLRCRIDKGGVAEFNGDSDTYRVQREIVLAYIHPGEGDRINTGWLRSLMDGKSLLCRYPYGTSGIEGDTLLTADVRFSLVGAKAIIAQALGLKSEADPIEAKREIDMDRLQGLAEERCSWPDLAKSEECRQGVNDCSVKADSSPSNFKSCMANLPDFTSVFVPELTMDKAKFAGLSAPICAERMGELLRLMVARMVSCAPSASVTQEETGEFTAALQQNATKVCKDTSPKALQYMRSRRFSECLTSIPSVSCEAIERFFSDNETDKLPSSCADLP